MKRNTMTLVGLAALFALLFAVAGSGIRAQNETSANATIGATRVAFVDVPTIMAGANFVQELRESINKDFKTRVEQYQARQQEYARFQDEIRSQQAVLSEEAMADKVKKSFQMKALLDEEKYTIDKFLKESETKNLMPAQERIINAVHDVAKTEGYHMVFRRELLIFGDPALDISQKVIVRLNGTSS